MTIPRRRIFRLSLENIPAGMAKKQFSKRPSENKNVAKVTVQVLTSNQWHKKNAKENKKRKTHTHTHTQKHNTQTIYL